MAAPAMTPAGSTGRVAPAANQPTQNRIDWGDDSAPDGPAVPPVIPEQGDGLAAQVNRTLAEKARDWIDIGLHHAIEDSRHKSAILAGITNSAPMTIPDLRPHMPPIIGPKKFVVRLIENDTLDAAHTIHRAHPNDSLAILNFANGTIAGGYLLNGSTAQEESILMRTSLYRSLKRSFYPLRSAEVIYSPSILIARSNNNTHEGAPIPEQSQYLINAISCAALNRPPLIQDPSQPEGIQTWSDPTDKGEMSDKLQTILAVACDQRIKYLVLGAFGCGSFRNPTRAVAQLMKETLLGHGTSHLPLENWPVLGLEEVVIAIHDTDVANNKPTWNAFVDVFRSAPPPIVVDVEVDTLGDVVEISHSLFFPAVGFTPVSSRNTPSDTSRQGDTRQPHGGGGAGAGAGAGMGLAAGVTLAAGAGAGAGTTQVKPHHHHQLRHHRNQNRCRNPPPETIIQPTGPAMEIKTEDDLDPHIGAGGREITYESDDDGDGDGFNDDGDDDGWSDSDG